MYIGQVVKEKSAGRLRCEREFKAACGIVDPIPRFVVIGVNMGEPPNTTSSDCFEIGAVFVKNTIVILSVII